MYIPYKTALITLISPPFMAAYPASDYISCALLVLYFMTNTRRKANLCAPMLITDWHFCQSQFSLHSQVYNAGLV